MKTRINSSDGCHEEFSNRIYHLGGETASNLASNSYTVITILLLVYDNPLDFAYWEDTIRLSHFRKVAPPLKFATC